MLQQRVASAPRIDHGLFGVAIGVIDEYPCAVAESFE